MISRRGEEPNDICAEAYQLLVNRNDTTVGMMVSAFGDWEPELRALIEALIRQAWFGFGLIAAKSAPCGSCTPGGSRSPGDHRTGDENGSAAECLLVTVGRLGQRVDLLEEAGHREAAFAAAVAECRRRCEVCVRRCVARLVRLAPASGP